MEFLSDIKVIEYKDQFVTVGQVKYDGHYTELYKSETGIVICMKKRNINLWPKLRKHPSIAAQVNALPNNTVMRCELHAPDVPATSVPTLTNDADHRLRLSPFKIETLDGDKYDGSFASETHLLNKLFDCPPLVDVSKFLEYGVVVDVEGLLNLAIDMKIEGFVLKDKPWGNLYKIKPQRTVDAFVTSTTISESLTYYGKLKAVQISVYDGDKIIEIASCGSGFDGPYKNSVDPKSLLGRVGEFKYQNVAAQGRLKFPRFIRWRDNEKTAQQCTVDQLKGV